MKQYRSKEALVQEDQAGKFAKDAQCPESGKDLFMNRKKQPKPVAELPDLVAQATNSRPSVRADQPSSQDMEHVTVGTGSGRKRRPLTVRAEFVVVSGREGEALEAYQGAVILDILRWIHDHQEPSDQ